jgi:phage terminase Nu1 subunit (DNA packaging protein)
LSSSGNSSWIARVEQANSPQEMEALFQEMERAGVLPLDHARPETRAGPDREESDEPPPATMFVTTLREVADWFGVKVQTARQWRTEAPPMPGEPGHYDLREITRWRVRKAETWSQNEARAPRNKVADQIAEIELATAKLDLAKKEGVLVRRDAVLAEARAMAARLAGRLDQLPEEMAAVEPDPERRARLLIALRHSVGNMRRDVTNWGDEPLPAEGE